MLRAVEDVNKQQKKVIVEKVIRRFGEDLSRYTFAVWGLAFKPETDDMREAPSITIINELTKRGAKIQAYDPQAEREAQEFYLKGNTRISYAKNKYDALNEVDALLLLTEWKEFRSPDFYQMADRMKGNLIVDGRNQYSRKSLERIGFIYEEIGVKNQ